MAILSLHFVNDSVVVVVVVHDKNNNNNNHGDNRFVVDHNHILFPKNQNSGQI